MLPSTLVIGQLRLEQSLISSENSHFFPIIFLLAKEKYLLDTSSTVGFIHHFAGAPDVFSLEPPVQLNFPTKRARNIFQSRCISLPAVSSE